MATTGVGFRWLDILEKEFDKACVELDTSIAELETEEPEVVYGARQKIATLSSCFSQLTHKALTIFQNSAKLEAELVDMRAELVQARAACAGGLQDAGDGAGLVPEAARARAEAAQLARENAALRDTVLALHSELFGARLATKYLDKELAGRIQQLQLLGREMRSELRDSLWAQVEAEILLQRHKTLVRVCRGLSPRPARPPPAPTHPPAPAAVPPLAAAPAPVLAACVRDARSRPRSVRVRRSPHLGLGISVTGGREHGVPILISELEAGGPAALTRELYVGDAILAINDLDLTQACHKEAVQALQSVKGDCQLCVQFIATDDDDRLSEDNYRFPLYPEDGGVSAGEGGCGPGAEGDGSGATPTAPRTPDYTHRVDSDPQSDSECGRGQGQGRGLGVYDPPHVTHVTHATPYPDYNSINNNLNILDMDDDSIKIETRLEHVVHLESPPGSPGGPRRGPYRALPSSADSPSTPVHAPHPAHPARRAYKKKRRPDWRAKGSYRAVGGDHSSDDSDRNLDRPAVAVAESQCGAPTVPVPAPPAPPAPPAAAFNNAEAARPHPHPLNNPNGDSKPANGEIKPARREPKAFRIGSARRITEHLPYTNGDVEKSKFPACLLAGEGDPDFGTPV